MRDKDTHLLEEQYQNLFEQQEEQPFTVGMLGNLLQEEYFNYYDTIQGISDQMEDLNTSARTLDKTATSKFLELIEKIDKITTIIERLTHLFNAERFEDFIRLIIEIEHWDGENGIHAFLRNAGISYSSLDQPDIQKYVSYLKSINS